MRARHLTTALTLLGLFIASAGFAATQQQVANYLYTQGIVSDPTAVNLWMTAGPLDPSYVVRDQDPAVPDVVMPFPLTWIVMIDDEPKANFGHPVRWVFVSDDLIAHTVPLANDFPPSVWGSGGLGPEVDFGCVPLSPPFNRQCILGATGPTSPGPTGTDKKCLYALFICGQPNDRYVRNLRSMYKKLRACGYPKANISVYYLAGDSLDLDGDGLSDVAGSATKGVFRPKLQGLCANLNPLTDVLLIYTTNHGAKNQGLCLPLDKGKGVYYTPAEFASDTKNCKACRIFVIMDQCYSGQFTSVATDGNHANMAVYTAASAHEPSVARHYMSYWELQDPATNTMNQMHNYVSNRIAPPNDVMTCDGGANFCELCTVDGDCPGSTCSKDDNSTPQSAEGTAGIGNVSICNCCSGGVVPTLVSLVSSEAGPGWARLEWYTSGAGSQSATLYREESGQAWTELATLVANGTGMLNYLDKSVTVGHRYGYRLGITVQGVVSMLGETWVTIPNTLQLAIDARENPAVGELAAWVTLPTDAPARLQVFDVSGREVWRNDVGRLGTGQHLVTIEGGRLGPGVYLLRLGQNGRVVTTRATIVR